MVDAERGWLHEAQTFAAGLLNAEALPPSFLTSSSGANDPRRYAVYRNNVTASLIRAMEANFPAIARLVGEEFFSAMAQVFVSAHPPRSRLLTEYGADFPAFLEEFPPVEPYPYLADVARIEQMWREAFHETDAPILAAKDFAVLSSEQLPTLRLAAHPACRILSSRFAAGSIFTANRSDTYAEDIDPAKGEWVLVTRPCLDCEVRILGAASGAFINALIEGETLETAAAAAMATSDPFDLATNISGLIASGAFTSIQGIAK